MENGQQCHFIKKTIKMKKTRRNIFETNSSSVHSIVVKYDGKYIMNLERDKKNPFAVVAYCMDYSCVGHDKPYVLSTQQDKFNYIISWICCKEKYSCDDYKDGWVYQYVLNALKIVDPQIDDIIVKNEDAADFDHQTAPYSYSDCVVDIYNEHAIMNFIFNDNITLECSFD